MGVPWPFTHYSVAYDVRNIVCNGTAAWKIMFIGSEWMERSPSNHSASTPTILFHTNLGWVGSMWKVTGVSWATAQLIPTPSDPTNPRTLSPCWKSRDTFIMTRQAAIASLIKVSISTDLSGEGTSNCFNDPWKYDEIFTGKNHFWYLKTHFCNLKTGLSSEHDESQWTSRQCLCTSMIAIWLTSGWKWRKF